VALPNFNEDGDLPEGVHRATLDEVVARFGQDTLQRRTVTVRLLEVYRLAAATGKLERFVLFGSYVTAKPEPNDVDIILVMRDDFLEPECDEETRGVFNHERAASEWGASIFWTTPSGILVGTVDDFIAHWQVKRGPGRRGVVEVAR
jgi:hypothetical protein